jgi:putative tricarboxylic transport membrane protein
MTNIIDRMTMPISRRNVLRGAGAAGTLAALGERGNAQSAFPARPIEILVPWSAGGGAAQIAEVARQIITENKLSAQPLTITNKPGASGLIGTALVADRKGSPYTFMPGGGALLAQVVVGESPVHPLKDLTPLALSAVDSSVVITSAKSRFKTMADVIDQLKKSPRSVTMAGAGGGAASWDGMLEIASGAVAGVEFNQIPFSGGGEVQAAVLGQQVDVGTRQLSNAQKLLEAGEMKALAIFDAERNPKLPNVPTMRELGYDVVLNLSRGWFAPPNLKAEEVQWYADLFRKLAEVPAWKAYLDKSGVQPRYLGPADWAKFVEDGMTSIHALYKRVGVVK